MWRQDTSRAAEARAQLSRRGRRWALDSIACQYLTVAGVAEGLAMSWNTTNDAVLAEGKLVLIARVCPASKEALKLRDIRLVVSLALVGISSCGRRPFGVAVQWSDKQRGSLLHSRLLARKRCTSELALAGYRA